MHLIGHKTQGSEMLLKYGRVQTIGEDGGKERNGKSEVSGAATGNFRQRNNKDIWN